MNGSPRHDVAVVAIGRNEGDRLMVCLQSALRDARVVVYVDSNSTDDSVVRARDLGATIVELDPSIPFSAARARNEGMARVRECHPEIEFIHVVDGDCEFVEGWIDQAVEVMQREETVAVVCGRRRERAPDETVFNRLCDMEWNTPVGEASGCGGDALLRVSAMDQIGGYDASVIAGEEPEMCARLRDAGWRILRVDADMTLHDARMTEIGQWWRRMVRSGFAHAQNFAMHGRAPHRLRAREVRSEWVWGAIVPLAAIGTAPFTSGLSLLLLSGYVLVWWRIRRWRIAYGDHPRHAGWFATHLVLGKFPQMIGELRYLWTRMRGQRGTVIEYRRDRMATADGQEEERRHAA